MSRFNTNTSYPLIPNANEYMVQQKVVSIHSEDRDYTKWPVSSNFEIELPCDYVNVSTVKLGSYTFPANYNTFSVSRGNLGMTFKITDPYNPSIYPAPIDPLLLAIYDILYANINNNYLLVINEGFYNPIQMATELTNQMNIVVTKYITQQLKTDPTYSVFPNLLIDFEAMGGYDQFVVAYNDVGQSLWFGNKSSGFTLTNDSLFYQEKKALLDAECSLNYQLPDFSNWGLPSYLGFVRCPSTTVSASTRATYPRFTYGDALIPGDNGYWLTPDILKYKNRTVFFLQAPSKINLMGDAYFYMEIIGLNNIDETSPFALNHFTTTSNMTMGVHNSAFAKIGVTTTPISQWFDVNTEAIKIYNPPAERIRRIRVKLRYHNGEFVNFGKFAFSFNLIFTLLVPQGLRSSTIYEPTSQGLQSSSSGFTKR